mgnify:CR=1 FL=1
MKKRAIAILVLLFAGMAVAAETYYLLYNVPGQSAPVQYGPMKSLLECQEDMAKFQGKFGSRMINPRCIKR